MHIREILAGGETKFSFEFFPPRTVESAVALSRSISDLRRLHPAFVSVTYGAGGSTRQATHHLVTRIKRKTNLHTVPHLTCIGHTKREVSEILKRYALAGVTTVLALRGDPPKTNASVAAGDFPHAADLVRFIRKFSKVHGYDFGIGVAAFPEGHPRTPNRVLEMDYLKEKVDAGADYICTQLFFDNHDFYDLRDRCLLAGIEIPILAGIMPITSLAGLNRMAELAAGARFPARLLKALARAKGDESVARRIGIHYASAQCSDLLDHQVKGIHLYTLNQSAAVLEIFKNLGISKISDSGASLPQPREAVGESIAT